MLRPRNPVGAAQTWERAERRAGRRETTAPGCRGFRIDHR